MARFLFAIAPVAGHMTPTLPIARALVERGHQILLIAGKIYRNRVEAAGASYYPMPQALDPGETELYDFHPELKQLHGLEQLKWYVKHTFIGTAPLQMGAIDSALGQFPADALVGDLPSMGIFYKSEQCGIPSALISLTPLAMPSSDTAPFGLGLLPGQGVAARLRNRLLNWLSDHVLLLDVNVYENRIRGQLGLAPRRAPFVRAAFEFPALVLQLSTPAFEYPRGDLTKNLRYSGPILPLPDPSYALPAWWQDLRGNRPVILVNHGTVANSAKDLVSAAMVAFKDEPVLVLAIPFSGQSLGAIPDNVRAEKFFPHDRLLPFVDVMVTNGGYGAVQQALAHGVPMVVAAGTEEKMEVAARVEWCGAGINLRQQYPSPARLKAAVREVLTNEGYRRNAQRIQLEFAEFNGATCAAELLEGLLPHARDLGQVD